MSVKVQPMPGYVVTQAEEAQTKTASGLYLPGGAAEKPKSARVVAVGPGVQGVKVGDHILYKDDYQSGNVNSVKVDGEEYSIIDQRNIVATV